MITERELWACANHYIQQHGENAGVMAAMRCDELLDACDYEGARTFQAIIEADQSAARTPERIATLIGMSLA